MAFGKPRSAGRRTSSAFSAYSGGYCTSTVIMLVFIMTTVLALWMLTTSSIVPPQKTTSSTTMAFSSDSNYKFPKSIIRPKKPHAFHDSQGELPDDAVKSETLKISQETKEALMDRARDPEVTATAELPHHVVEEEAEEDEKGKSENVEAAKNGNKLEEQKGAADVRVMQDSNGHDNEEHRKREEESNAKESESQSEGENKESSHQNQEGENKESTQQETTESESKENPEQQILQKTENENEENNIVQQTQNQEKSQEETPESNESTQQESETNESNGSSQQHQENESENQQHSHQLSQQETEGESNGSSQQQQENESENQQHSHQLSQQETEGESNGSSQQQQSQQESQSENQQQQSEHSQESQQELHEMEHAQEADSSQQSHSDESQQQQDDATQQGGENKNEQQHQDENGNGGNEGKGSDSKSKSAWIPKESKESKESWSTQKNQSENQKERRKEDGYSWALCNVTAGADYIPCLDNEKALKKIRITGHYEHRERHCPDVGPTCLVPLPLNYKKSIEWPKSRDKIWYHNVPHTKLAEVKGHQNWVKVTGEFLTFPGGGTQFIHGALHYINFLESIVPPLKWGKRTRVVLDVGCGVASFGGYLFDKDVLTMSFAPKDEHEAQVQFALERGIPAISAVMGTQRLQFPSRVFDAVHCARCRVPWDKDGGMLLLELNRVLRPGGYFLWSATPVYQKLKEDVEIWKAMSKLTASMCWDLVTIKKDKLNGVGAAIYRKPVNNDCYEQRKHKSPPICKNDDDANAAWYVPLQACMHRVPVDESLRGSRWPEMWPARVHKTPYWLNSSQKGNYGKSAPDDFNSDYEHWKQVVTKTYMGGLDISWSNVRNVMDMRAVYGGFAAALKDLKVWVMNVVNVDSPDTLPIIYERGLFGIYHDWCESFSTYPRTYDLLHADHLFSNLKQRCNLLPVIAEVDRIVRPGGKLIVRDEDSMIGEIEGMLKSLHWEIHLSFSQDQKGILSAQKTDWRPQTYSSSL